MRAQAAQQPSLSRPRAIRWIALTLGVVFLLTAGVAAWALNRYVIDHVEVENASSYEQLSNTSNSSQAVITDTTYTTDNTSITISKVEKGSGIDQVTYFLADITTTDATLVRSAFAEDKFGTSIVQRTSEIAAANNAIFAINGDYYGFRDDGILIRNGVIYRDKPARIGMAFYQDGTAKIYDETETSAEELLAAGVWNTLSFGPALVENGSIVADLGSVEVDTNFGNHSIQGTHPRTAVGVIDANHYVFVVVDGRERGYSRGMSLDELAQVMADLGATTAYNLDGGGSSTMYFNGEVINQPSNRGERATSDILYVAK